MAMPGRNFLETSMTSWGGGQEELGWVRGWGLLVGSLWTSLLSWKPFPQTYKMGGTLAPQLFMVFRLHLPADQVSRLSGAFLTLLDF